MSKELRFTAAPSAADCQKFAATFARMAAEPETPARTASIMKNVARSFTGLAKQLAMLES